METGAPLRLLIDANVHHGVGGIFQDAGCSVEYVTETFMDGTPDDEIEIVARRDGWIIVSQDRRFLSRIQQPRYAYSDPASTGFGRIMLMTSAARHQSRIRETFPMIALLHAECLRSDLRFLLTIGEHFIRMDDRPRR